jgi:hypothetical protein
MGTKQITQMWNLHFTTFLLWFFFVRLAIMIHHMAFSIGHFFPLLLMVRVFPCIQKVAMLEWPLVWILDIVANSINFMIIHETINIIFVLVINCLIMWYLIQFQIHFCYYIMLNYHLQTTTWYVYIIAIGIIIDWKHNNVVLIELFSNAKNNFRLCHFVTSSKFHNNLQIWNLQNTTCRYHFITLSKNYGIFPYNYPYYGVLLHSCYPKTIH